MEFQVGLSVMSLGLALLGVILTIYGRKALTVATHLVVILITGTLISVSVHESRQHRERVAAESRAIQDKLGTEG